MKRDYFKILSLFISVLILVAACEKPEIQKSNDAYEWDKVAQTPYIVNGPATVIASGQTPGAYSVPFRGGSTWTWSVPDWESTIVVDPEKTYNAAITWGISEVRDTVATISVVETTWAGVVGEPKTRKIKLLRFCAIDLTDYTGSYTEADGDGQTAPIESTLDPDDALFGIILNGILGEAYWWGPPGGVLKVKLNNCDQTLFFDKQTTGIVDPTYGAVSMELLDGEPGWFDPDDFSMGYQGKVTVAAGSFGDYPFVYTKN